MNADNADEECADRLICVYRRSSAVPIQLEIGEKNSASSAPRSCRTIRREALLGTRPRSARRRARWFYRGTEPERGTARRFLLVVDRQAPEARLRGAVRRCET